MFLLYMAISLVMTACALALAVSSLAKAEDVTVRELLSEMFDGADGEEALAVAFVALILLVVGCFLGPLALLFSILYAVIVWVIKRVNK